jgi:hypothetical protein
MQRLPLFMEAEPIWANLDKKVDLLESAFSLRFQKA